MLYIDTVKTKPFVPGVGVQLNAAPTHALPTHLRVHSVLLSLHPMCVSSAERRIQPLLGVG